MEPPVTTSPPKRFTPRRCALESRPFLELPKPFLCAIRKPLQRDVANGQLGVVLPVTDGPLVLLFALEFEDDQLVAATLASDGGVDASVSEAVCGEHLTSVVRS